jgi:hypothetical protein
MKGMINAVRSGGTWKHVMQVPIMDETVSIASSHVNSRTRAGGTEADELDLLQPISQMAVDAAPKDTAPTPVFKLKNVHETDQAPSSGRIFSNLNHPVPSSTLQQDNGDSSSSPLITSSAKGSTWSSSPCGSNRKVGSDRSTQGQAAVATLNEGLG